MKFLLDESADSRIASFLRQQGHDVTVIAQDYPASLADQAVLAIALCEQRVLITNDRDFGELIFAGRMPHAGVILFRLSPITDLALKIDRLEFLLTNHAAQLDQFVVVTKDRVRIR
jgi:predicted nuclease of predicted toxin-antitoxin system